MNEWIETTVGEYIPFIYGKNLPKSSRRNGNISVYGSNGAVGSHSEAYVYSAGIIIGRKGSVGAVHFSKEPFWPIDTAFFIKKQNAYELLYDFYLLKSLGLEHMNSDSAVPGLNRDNAHALKIKIPKEKNYRISIGKWISTLDDKIENNRQMNETLEQMARAIFKSWFVDFDPVHAKAAGKKPARMDAATAALFPDSFGENGLPMGWKYGKLGDAMSIYDSKRIPLSKIQREKKHGTYPYYGATSCMDYVDEYLFDGIYLLMGEDGSVARENGTPFLQYVWGQFWVNNHAHVLQGANGFSTEHLFCGLNSVNVFPYVTGAVQPKLNQANMKRIPLVMPTKSVLKAFSDSISPFFDKRRLNIEENKALAELRDVLLPKLMSGEIRIKDAEREAQERV